MCALASQPSRVALIYTQEMKRRRPSCAGLVNRHDVRAQNDVSERIERIANSDRMGEANRATRVILFRLFAELQHAV